jgi:hypothetical protein
MKNIFLLALVTLSLNTFALGQADTDCPYTRDSDSRQSEDQSHESTKSSESVKEQSASEM